MPSSDVLNFAWRPRMRLLRQSEAGECGLACVGMAASWFGYSVDLATLRREHPVSSRGSTLKDVIRVAEDLGLAARPVRCELASLPDLQTPAILHWDMKHFVVLVSAQRDRVEILDPAKGRLVLKLHDLDRHFTGVALELRPTARFQLRKERTALRIADLVKPDRSIWSAFGQGLVLSILLQVFVVMTPLFMQLVIDQAVANYDVGLLIAVCAGFLFLKIFEVAATVMRSLAFQFISSALTYDMRSNVFRHMLRLPLNYFYRRHVGDIQQRFVALQPIGDFVVNGAISALIDGVLAIGIGILVFAYDFSMGVVVVVGLAVYVLMRVYFLGFSMRATEKHIEAQAQESSKFLETLRSMQTLKAAGVEQSRGSDWGNLLAEVVNANIRLGNINIGYAAISQFVLAASTILVVYMAAGGVIGGTITIGAMTAFLAYKGQLEQRLGALIELYLKHRMLGVYLDRVGDLALEPVEEAIDLPDTGREFSGQVDVRTLSFRYSPQEGDILKNVSLSIRPGEFVAVTGVSGSGKSTLLRLITGLYRPTEGEILFDEASLSAWGPRNLRRQIGAVFQDDVLLAGSIADNISMFDEQQDFERIAGVARIACIHDDIEKMPMGYRTLVGDMGSSLSGGQQQRIMIARALYRKPALLVMDEATAHLDVATEARVINAIKASSITCIAAAHRPDTIAAATRVVLVTRGGVSEGVRPAIAR